MKLAKLSIALVIGLSMVRVCHAEPSIDGLLAASDRARAGGLPGLIWDVRVTNSGSANIDKEPSVLQLKATVDASLAEYLEPLRSKGSRILQVGRNMWFSKPGLHKPVAISPRQRLTGLAAIGDIAATDYVHDYKAKYLGKESIDGQICYVLDLTSARENTTYDHIVYWIAAKGWVGIHADFYSISGKLLKKADLVYDNRINFQGKTAPFISKMSIFDALTDARTVLEYSKIKIEEVPRSEFDVANLR